MINHDNNHQCVRSSVSCYIITLICTSYSIAMIFKPLSVATMAEVMMQDAWNYFSSGGSSAPADKVTIFEKDDIHRLGEVRLTSLVVMEHPSWVMLLPVALGYMLYKVIRSNSS